MVGGDGVFGVGVGVGVGVRVGVGVGVGEEYFTQRHGGTGTDRGGVDDLLISPSQRPVRSLRFNMNQEYHTLKVARALAVGKPILQTKIKKGEISNVQICPRFSLLWNE